MDTARSAVELFLTDDPARAAELARELHERNAMRQQVEADIRDACEAIAVEDDAAALVYYADEWHRGVLGIVAGRLVERWRRPVFVLSRNPEDGLAQGSGRSIPAFHLLEALESMPDLFVRFGGHRQAAGVTLEVGRVPEFRERFNAYAAARLRPEDFLPLLEIDALLELDEIGDSAVRDTFALAPFGLGNPPPLYAALDLEVAGPPRVWNERHLSLSVRKGRRTVTLKGWNLAGRTESAELVPGARIDIAFSLEEDAFGAARGLPGWAAILHDARRAVQALEAGLRRAPDDPTHLRCRVAPCRNLPDTP
jgi:single-stranded-DNA-specific exonuclease